MLVQPGMHDAGLNADTVAARILDPPHVARKIDHQSASQRLAGQAGAGAAGMDRQFVFAGVAHHRHHVGQRTRPHHRQRTDLENAGVAGVELREDVVAMHVPFDQPSQVVFDPLAFLIHELVLTAGRPRKLLAMPLVRFQTEGAVPLLPRDRTILGIAAIAHQRVGHDEIQRDVGQRRADQYGKRP